MILGLAIGLVAGFGLALGLGLCRCAAKRMPSIHEVAARDEKVFSATDEHGFFNPTRKKKHYAQSPN